MFRAAFWVLRQRRYQALAVAGLLVLIVCVTAGTFEWHRYFDKRQGNGALKTNAAAATVALTPSLVPLTGHGSPPDALAIRYRTVSVTGRYDAGAQRVLAGETQGNAQGFWVLTPLRTTEGDLIVVRGFVAATSAGRLPAHVAAAPAGPVRITGRLQNATSEINPVAESSRLGRPVFQTYLQLDKGAPGTAGLRSLPKPSLSNPTGGASEWQLLSYVVQWYVFALLALIAPFLFARSEVRASRARYLGVDEDSIQFDDPPVAVAGDRLALTGSGSRGELEGAARDGELAVLDPGALARRDPAFAARMARAQKLADRYNRPLGPDPERVAAAALYRPVPREQVVRDSNVAAHRAMDSYHAQYNDYLWQLALADGQIPDVLPRDDADDADDTDGTSDAPPAPRIVDAQPSDARRDDDERGDPRR